VLPIADATYRIDGGTVIPVPLGRYADRVTEYP